jgi:hypothetical protein
MNKSEDTRLREALSDASIKKEENKREKRNGQEEERCGEARGKERSWAALRNTY